MATQNQTFIVDSGINNTSHNTKVVRLATGSNLGNTRIASNQIILDATSRATRPTFTTVTSNTITTSIAHGLSTGQEVVLIPTAAGLTIGGVALSTTLVFDTSTATNRKYAIVISSTQLKFTDTLKKALQYSSTNDTSQTITNSTTVTVDIFHGLDGNVFQVNDRVLVKNMTSKQYNGIYYVASVTVPTSGVMSAFTLTRTSDFKNIQLINNSIIKVYTGNDLAGKNYSTQIATNGTLNTTAINVAEIYSTTSTLPGNTCSNMVSTAYPTAIGVYVDSAGPGGMHRFKSIAGGAGVSVTSAGANNENILISASSTVINSVISTTDSSSTSTTMANVPNMSFNVIAGSYYVIDVFGTFTTAAATTAFKVGFTCPSSNIKLLGRFGTTTTTNSWTSTQSAAASSVSVQSATTGLTAATEMPFKLHCIFIPTASGTIQLQIGSGVNASSVSMKLGTSMIINNITNTVATSAPPTLGSPVAAVTIPSTSTYTASQLYVTDGPAVNDFTLTFNPNGTWSISCPYGFTGTPTSGNWCIGSGFLGSNYEVNFEWGTQLGTAGNTIDIDGVTGGSYGTGSTTQTISTYSTANASHSSINGTYNPGQGGTTGWLNLGSIQAFEWGLRSPSTDGGTSRTDYMTVRFTVRLVGSGATIGTNTVNSTSFVLRMYLDVSGDNNTGA